MGGGVSLKTDSGWGSEGFHYINCFQLVSRILNTIPLLLSALYTPLMKDAKFKVEKRGFYTYWTKTPLKNQSLYISRSAETP